MLSEVHITNFALIEQADLTFRGGLNVLSGETGAGKSILIDAILAALGGKTGRDAVRTGAESAYIELLFEVKDPAHLKRLQEMEIGAEEDGTLMVSRKILKNRSVFRVNGEAVTASLLRELTAFLIDIHGQHDQQALFSAERHLGFVDALSGTELSFVKEQYSRAYLRYREIRELLKKEGDKAVRDREREILDYEIREIREAALREGEEEELEAEFRLMKNAAKIGEALSEAEEALSTDTVSRAVRALREISSLSPGLQSLLAETEEIDDLLSEALRNTGELSRSLEYDPQRMEEVQRRLDRIRYFLDRYADSVPGVMDLLAKKEERLQFLTDFEENRGALKAEYEELSEQLRQLSGRLTSIRKKTALALSERVRNELLGLNFQSPEFEVRFSPREEFGPDGSDRAEFFLSTNPGEPLKPLRSVASGGELSRVMLALKTVLSEQDELETIIFDEIDTGISGRTAQMAAERLSGLGRGRQVLCITHLPQIAAMADHHYLIRKDTDGTRTWTAVKEIAGQEITEELARLIGGTEITEGVLRTAEEMKTLAQKRK